MGVQLKELVEGSEISIGSLGGKKIAIDAFNTLYQFITIIRQRDGTPLMDSRGRITSHLSGVLYRTAKLMESGVRPCFVFDGKPPEFKLAIRDRKEAKREAEKKLEEARRKGDLEGIRKYSERAAKLEDYMIEDSKKLLSLMGIPWVQAPSEGEAQAAYMAISGDVWAVGSQDSDSLLFGAPRLIRNLTITGRRKLPYKNAYIEVTPKLLDLQRTLDSLNIDRKQLICLGILVGTDFNPGGIRGIGPKKGLELVREKGCKALGEFEWSPEWPSAEEILEFFLNPPITEKYELEWKEPDTEGMVDLLVGRHDFSEDRVRKVAKNLEEAMKRGRQVGLEQFFR